jgi:hypothetical protein
MAEDGEIIVQVYKDHAVLTLRQPHHERLCEVTVTEPQGNIVADLLNKIPLGAE